MTASRPNRRWRRPPAELIRFVRSLAVDDARRDHDATLEAARRRTTAPTSFPIERGLNRR